MSADIEQFVAHVKGQLRKDMNDYCDAMASGACKDFESYKELCGKIRGLAQAEDYLLAALKEWQQHDNG